MSGIKDQAEIEAMRRRLYERGPGTQAQPRAQLSDISPQQVPRAWTNTPPPPPPPRPAPVGDITSPTLTVSHPSKPVKRHRYRTVVLLGTIALFLLVLGVTGMYMFLGNNQISNKNIDLSIAGPFSVGGGEVLPLELEIKNGNTVAIESAVLIVNYPTGSKSDEEEPKDKLEERQTIGSLAAGETLKIPVSAIVFGEENQERTVQARIEYRLVGSSGTFYKEATPFNFKINSSPVVIRVNTVKKVSSGQEIDIVLTVQSNAPTPLKDILVTADYPSNFDYSSAEPSPAYRENAWLISELRPEKTQTIRLRGAIVGQQDEEFQLKFSAGAAKPENQFEVGSVLATAVADFLIEQPFINVGLRVNNVESEVVTARTGEQTTVSVIVRNTLNDSLYDMVVEVGVKGNILVRDRVNAPKGYYDSVKDVIRFDPSGDPDLEQVPPGETRTFSFSLKPGEETATPAFTLTANAFARRVSESNATEQLVGTAKSEVKFTSNVAISRELGRGNAGFSESGPFPPVADKATTYTITMFASAGGNDVTGATVSTALPQYVSWQNQTTGDGTMTFNPVTKEVLWNIGDITAGTRKQVSFQVSLLPSQNQIGQVPAILSAQRFRATDRFTGDVVRAESAPLATELSEEAGYEEGNGFVRRTETSPTGREQ